MKVYKFYSQGCGPCKVVDKNLKEVGIKYTSIDIMNESEYASPDDDYSMLEYYKIRSVPTLIITNDEGKVMDKFVGVITTAKLRELIELWDLECNE